MMSEDNGLLSRISGAVSSTTGAVKSALDAAKEVHQLTVDYQVKEKTIDLLNKILDVQSQQIDLKDLLASAKQRIIELEDDKKQREQWNAEKSCYLLCEVVSGTYVYRVDPAKKPDAPLHYICPACYEKSVKSILQMEGSTTVQDTHFCPTCKVEFRFPSTVKRMECPRPLNYYSGS
ncbi:hypothetical protein J5069_02760 [Candidatus Symbiopectobacterium sp. NZEC127]|uniref:hypothetical protein n=1 Tax=Candidatus Symbiopectobacterium sp. NZEC127 TaxID=2820472 RepID=UPI002226ACC3|nr:hypothetical protein [Candidatus Symbiopectobacterium sp. NZEC127]MCW2484811.1 hypothetical protein [Candidatus Symbiopectobacterium sp. NZEC127]